MNRSTISSHLNFYFLMAFIGIMLGGALTIKAQESGIINGLVLETGKSLRVGSVTVLNKRSGLATSSSSMGVFEIYASVGDTLLLTKIGYLPAKVTIKTLSDILIDLRRETIVLEAVTIDRITREQELEDVMEGYKRHGIYGEGKPKPLAYVFQPITALYERFSRSGKQARRFRNFMNHEVAANQVDRVYSKDKITALTGLEEPELNNFYLLYKPTYDQVVNWAEYDMINYIMTSFKKFDAAGRPEAPKLPPLKPISLQEIRKK